MFLCLPPLSMYVLQHTQDVAKLSDQLKQAEEDRKTLQEKVLRYSVCSLDQRACSLFSDAHYVWIMYDHVFQGALVPPPPVDILPLYYLRCTLYHCLINILFPPPLRKDLRINIEPLIFNISFSIVVPLVNYQSV